MAKYLSNRPNRSGVLTKTDKDTKKFLLYFSLAVVLLAAVTFMNWQGEYNTHRKLERSGSVTTAKVVSYQLKGYGGSKSRNILPVDDPDAAAILDVKVSYIVNGKVEYAVLSSSFSLRNNDHVSVYEDALNGSVLVRYLPSNPQMVRAEAEFSHPDENPYSKR